MRLTAAKRPTPTLPAELRHLGDHLRRRRVSLGLTRRAMAKRFGIDPSSYGKWEKGLTVPELHRRPQIVAELGYPLPASAPPPTTLGGRLRAWRTKHGLSRVAAGQRLGIDPKTILHVEHGRFEPSARVRGAIAAAIGPPTG